MKKTWNQKYEEWKKRTDWPIIGTKPAYHAGRRHQREAFRGEYTKIRKYYKEVDDWQDDLTEKFGALTREREVLTQANKSLTTERESLYIEKWNLQIENGSLKNQIRILRETIVELESRSWWQKFWKVDW